jgi:predicted membrane channel-forming protein YqfA (hemolysin III family)
MKEAEMTISVIGIAILAIIGFWLFGGAVLRVVGAVFVLVGLISLITLADPTALLMVVIGLVMWLAGHWHFALRHHEYKSPLAQRIFLQVLPPRYDPTRHWGAPVVSEMTEPAERRVEPEPTRSDRRI